MNQPHSSAAHEQKALGFLLLFFLVLTYKATVWDPYFHPPIIVTHAPQAASQTTAAPASAVPPATAKAQEFATVPGSPAAPASAAAAAPVPNPTDAQISSGGLVRVKNRVMELSLSLLGGRITQQILYDYRTDATPNSKPLDLIDHIEYAPYPLGVASGAVEDTWVKYEITGASVAPRQLQGFTGAYDFAEADEGVITLRGTLPDGRNISKVIRFKRSAYLFTVDVTLSAPPADGARLELEWTKLMGADSPSLQDPYNTTGLVAFDGQRAERTRFDSLAPGRFSVGNVLWLSLTEKYFAVSLISPKQPAPGVAMHTSELFRIRQAGEPQRGEFAVYAGPKSYQILMSTGFGLERNINFGIFAFLSVPLLSLLTLFDKFLGNYGLAIILLTILVRTALLPLSVASFKQMRAMNKLKPEVDRIRKDVKDKQQQQLELMSLYKKNGVNPLGGCLPLVLQIPIFLGLYNALLAAIELRHAPFAFWIHDLSAPEALMIAGIGIPVLVILFVASMLLQQWLTPTPGMDPMQKKMMMFMPLVFGFMFVTFPAGLTLYWLTSNIISIGQSKALMSEQGKSPFLVTAVISAGVFAFAFLLVQLS